MDKLVRTKIVLSVAALIAVAAGCAQHASSDMSSVPKAPPVTNTAPGGGLPPGVGQPATHR